MTEQAAAQLSYLPASFLRPSKLSEVMPSAILLPVDRYDEPFLVVGDEQRASVCFLGPNHTYRSFARNRAENFKGLAIEGVDFEVDVASAYPLDGYNPVLSSLVREGSTLSLATISEQQHFHRPILVAVSSSLDAGSEGERIGFSRWRAVLRASDDKFVLWNVDVAHA